MDNGRSVEPIAVTKSVKRKEKIRGKIKRLKEEMREIEDEGETRERGEWKMCGTRALQMTVWIERKVKNKREKTEKDAGIERGDERAQRMTLWKMREYREKRWREKL